ncbi:Myb/SANT-like DNA-binding domain [Popillia japonica]|uniref:Regulatory protein zeste n=1 Tax=Popillia japonica TaxID=7064 RepID=A0AAW1MFV9_POPJA
MVITSVNMAFKVKDIHWEIMLNYMEKHKEFATGKFTSINGRDNYKKLWIDLVKELTATGYGERSVEKWQKCWTDFKYALKRKTAAIKFDINGTGGGPQQSKQLNDLELRFLAVLGNSFAEGVGVPERGLPADNVTRKRTIDEVTCR